MATATRRVVRTMPQMFVEIADSKPERLQVAAYARLYQAMGYRVRSSALWYVERNRVDYVDF